MSAPSQATAIQALTRAAQRLGRHDLLALATQAVGAFSAAPPQGVGVRLERDGSWFALYSFAPGLRVLNAQLQAVSALFDLSQAWAHPLAAFLHREGLRATRRRIGSFDTGAWSRYAAPGRLADLNYHVLNRDLARAVCQAHRRGAICRAARHFAVQLGAPLPGGRARVSTYDAIAGLRLRVDGYALERLERAVSSDFTRVPTVIRCAAPARRASARTSATTPATTTASRRPERPPADRRVDAGLVRRAPRRGLDLFPEPPNWEPRAATGSWAYESAALDLALRQAGRRCTPSWAASRAPSRSSSRCA